MVRYASRVARIVEVIKITAVGTMLPTDPFTAVERVERRQSFRWCYAHNNFDPSRVLTINLIQS